MKLQPVTSTSAFLPQGLTLPLDERAGKAIELISRHSVARRHHTPS